MAGKGRASHHSQYLVEGEGEVLQMKGEQILNRTDERTKTGSLPRASGS